MRAARRTLTSSTPLRVRLLQSFRREIDCGTVGEAIETKLEGQRRISSAIL